jgi:hypothetical protein
MNTRGQRHSVGGGRCESIENQGPEAAREGDLYVRQEARGCVWHADTFRRCERTVVRKS